MLCDMPQPLPLFAVEDAATVPVSYTPHLILQVTPKKGVSLGDTDAENGIGSPEQAAWLGRSRFQTPLNLQLGLCPPDCLMLRTYKMRKTHVSQTDQVIN